MGMQKGSPSSCPPAAPSAVGPGGNSTITNNVESEINRRSWEDVAVTHAPEGYDDSVGAQQGVFKRQGL